MAHRLIVLLLSLAGAASAAGSDPYVLVNQKPPRVTLVDPVRLEVIAEIPIARHPVFSLRSPSGDSVFVLHDSCPLEQHGKASHTTLSIVDLPARKVRKSIPLGWNVASLAVSEDGRSLVGVDLGRPDVKKPKLDQLAVVHVIDTATGDDRRISAGRAARQWIVSRDGSRIFVLSVSSPGRVSPHYQFLARPNINVPGCVDRSGFYSNGGESSVLLLDAGAAKPAAVVPLPGFPSAMLLSPDERWLYVVDEGAPDRKAKDNVDAQLHVIDAQTGKLAGTHGLGTFPRWLGMDDESGELLVLSHTSYQDHSGALYRFQGNSQVGVTPAGRDAVEVQWLEGLQHPVLVTAGEVCPLREEGARERTCIELAPFEVGRRDPMLKPFARSPLLEIRYLPQPSVFALRTGQNGDRLILVDPRAQPEGVVLTMGRPEARAHRKAGNIAKDIGMVALGVVACAYGCGGLGVPNRPKPVAKDPWGSASSLVGADGRHLYTTNLYTNDLAVVDAESRRVAAYFPLGGDPVGLFFLQEKRFVCGFSADRIVVLDTASNRAVLEADVPGDIRQVAVPQGAAQIIAVTDHSMAVWDRNTLKPLGTVTGLSRPQLLIAE